MSSTKTNKNPYSIRIFVCHYYVPGRGLEPYRFSTRVGDIFLSFRLKNISNRLQVRVTLFFQKSYASPLQIPLRSICAGERT